MTRKEGEDFVKKILGYTFSITAGLGVLAGVIIGLVLFFTQRIDTINVDNLQSVPVVEEIEVSDED